MYRWAKRLHMYAGLFSFTAILVWGLTGLLGAVPFYGISGNGGPARRVALAVPRDMPDDELARRLAQAAGIEYERNPGAPQRNEAGRLWIRTYTINGRYDIEYFEDEAVAEVSFAPTNIKGFLSAAHTAVFRGAPPEPEARAWSLYNEAGLWSFGFMTFSGVYLWAATRPQLRWARWTASAAILLVAGLWAWTR